MAWRLIFVSSLLVIAAAIGAWQSARRFHQVMGDSLDRAYLSAAAFAQAAQQWVATDHCETLTYVANLMMSGGTRGIQVRSGKRLILELEASSGMFASLPEPDPFDDDEPDRGLVRASAGWMFEVRVSIDTPNEGTVQVHVLMDASPHRSQAVAAALKVWGIALGMWLCASLAILGVHRAWRQRSAHDRNVPRAAPLVVCPGSKRVHVRGHPVVLTPKQFGLLALVASKAGRIVTEQEILNTVWPDSPYADSNDIRQCIYKIRRRLGNAVPGAEASLVNEKGFGYRLAIDQLPEDASPGLQNRPHETQEEGDTCE